ncbi:hypothetical protein [Methylibium sp.]|uniref:hypothetical protein n=1 Tax=Methylibium sp. TaxID=2067992 RepID=UPI003D137167
MAFMGFREYARHRKCALSAVQKAVAAGRIVTVDVAGKPKIDSDQADRDWRLHTDPAKQSLLHSAGPDAELPLDEPDDDLDDAAAEEPAAAPGAAPAPTDPHTLSYRRSRAETESIRVQRAQIELDQLRGRLVDKDEVARLRFTEFRSLRDRLGNVGTRIKDACAAETDPLLVEQLIDGEVSAALADFASQVLTRGVMQDTDDDDEPD